MFTWYFGEPPPPWVSRIIWMAPYWHFRTLLISNQRLERDPLFYYNPSEFCGIWELKTYPKVGPRPLIRFQSVLFYINYLRVGKYAEVGQRPLILLKSVRVLWIFGTLKIISLKFYRDNLMDYNPSVTFQLRDFNNITICPIFL